MNLLDENFPADQRETLKRWGIPHRQIGSDVSELGIKDDNIIPFLHRLRRVTFFTRDEDFFEETLCHRAYCLVWLDVTEDESALYVRRFLRHNLFSTERKRLGIIARAHRESVHFWRLGQRRLMMTEWE